MDKINYQASHTSALINMSARNIQSDTSRVIVKNPLLSAVPGTIDDFVNNSILLPAAEIPVAVVPSPPLPSHDNLDPKDHRGNKMQSIWPKYSHHFMQLTVSFGVLA